MERNPECGFEALLILSLLYELLSKSLALCYLAEIKVSTSFAFLLDMYLH